MLNKKAFFLLSLVLFLSGCTGGVINYSSHGPINLNSKIAVIPLANNTETPLAGERAMSIIAATIESRGLYNIVIYRSNNRSNELLPGMGKVNSQTALLKWAGHTGAHYAMTGSVNEWTYKVGLDGEPVVGISLQLIELSTKRIVWTAVGSKSGGSRIAVSTVAQQLINSMLDRLFNSGHTNG